MTSLVRFQIFMFTLFFIIAGSLGYWYQIGTAQTINIKVSDKQRITSGSQSTYMVFTTQESFEDTDSFYHSKYNSTALFSALKVGCSYDIVVYGKRMPFFSTYRNIVEIVKEEPCS